MNSKLFSYNIYRQIAIAVLLLLAVDCGKTSNASEPTVDLLPVPFQDAVNINTATVEELQNIPKIGPKLAQEIVDYRNRHGAFRRPEHLMLVQGISDKRFREIRSYIRVE
jgi:competence protein ComEA